MTVVAGAPDAIVDVAAVLPGPVDRVLESVQNVRSTAASYTGASSTVTRARIDVPGRLEPAIVAVVDATGVLESLAALLEDLDARSVLEDAAALPNTIQTLLNIGLVRPGDLSDGLAAHWRVLLVRARTRRPLIPRDPGRPFRHRLSKAQRAALYREGRRAEHSLRSANSRISAGRKGWGTRLTSSMTSAADRFPRATRVARIGGRALGVAGVGFAGYDVFAGVRDGDAEQAVMGGLGLASAAAFAAGGPVGLAVGGTLVLGSLAWEHRETLGNAARAVTDSIGDAAGAVADFFGF